jgi:hypothetical protein
MVSDVPVNTQRDRERADVGQSRNEDAAPGPEQVSQLLQIAPRVGQVLDNAGRKDEIEALFRKGGIEQTGTLYIQSPVNLGTSGRKRRWIDPRHIPAGQLRGFQEYSG